MKIADTRSPDKRPLSELKIGDGFLWGLKHFILIDDEPNDSEKEYDAFSVEHRCMVRLGTDTKVEPIKFEFHIVD